MKRLAAVLLVALAACGTSQTARTNSASGASPAVSPSQCAFNDFTWEPAMAYDGRRKVVVRFGGEDSAGAIKGDTYLWDGKVWTRQAAGGPPARYGASMSFDPARGVVVLYGGFATAGYASPLGDTWTWDGSTWTQQHPAHVPAPRGEAASAFDVAHGQVVMFGGEGSTIYSGTWTWNGSDWTLAHPPQNPPGRHDAQLVWDDAAKEIVLFGGSIPGVYYNDLWTWDGSRWTPHPTAPSPPARAFFAMAYDDHLKSVVVVNGQGILVPEPPLDDMWAWDGVRWSQPIDAPFPSPRRGSAAVWDAGRRVIVLFGGFNAGLSSCGASETWTWDGTKWARR